MELNEKIEQRRRELANNAAQVAQAQAKQRQDEARKAEEARQDVARKAEEAKKAEKIAIDAEVARRLSELGVPPPPPAPIPVLKPVVAPANLVEAEIEKAIDKAASARMTGGENAKFAILLLLGFGGFFIKWWIGLAFLLLAGRYISKTTARYKEQIIAEGKAKLEKAYPAGTPHEQHPNVVWDGTGNLDPADGYEWVAADDTKSFMVRAKVSIDPS